MRCLLLLILCVALLSPARAPAQSEAEILVDALGCEVPVSTRYHVLPGHNGITFEIPHTGDTRIWIGPLTQHTDKPLDSQYRGALKVEHYKPGCFAISASLGCRAGLAQEIALIGLSDQEVAHVIEHCNATMNPEAVAIAARMAKGCAAVLPTDEVTKALFGKAGFSEVRRPAGQARRGLTRWRPGRSFNLSFRRASGRKAFTKVRLSLPSAAVPVSEVEEGGATLCCSTAVADHIDVTVVEEGKSRSITAPRAGTVKDGPLDTDRRKLQGSGDEAVDRDSRSNPVWPARRAAQIRRNSRHEDSLRHGRSRPPGFRGDHRVVPSLRR